MKFKILLFIACILSVISSAQAPQFVGPPLLLTEYRGGLKADSVFALPVRDTIGWTGSTFAMLGRITLRPQDKLPYYHNGVKWVGLMGTGGGGDFPGWDTLGQYVTLDSLTYYMPTEEMVNFVVSGYEALQAFMVKFTDSAQFTPTQSYQAGRPFKFITLYYADSNYLMKNATVTVDGVTKFLWTNPSFTTTGGGGPITVPDVNGLIDSLNARLRLTNIASVTPTGTLNGVNTTFSIPDMPLSGSGRFYRNGILQKIGAGNDYTLSGTTITTLFTPQSWETLFFTYIKQ